MVASVSWSIAVGWSVLVVVAGWVRLVTNTSRDGCAGDCDESGDHCQDDHLLVDAQG